MTDPIKLARECGALITKHPVRPGANAYTFSDEMLALFAQRVRAEALELADAALRGSNMNMNVVERKVKAALSLNGADNAS